MATMLGRSFALPRSLPMAAGGLALARLFSRGDTANVFGKDMNIGDNYELKKKNKYRPIHPVATSKAYLNSKIYEEVYGNQPVWGPYRRNFGGPNNWKWHPQTRRSCVNKNNQFTTNNPCPICRDEYLVLHHTHPRLLEQFIYPGTNRLVENRRCYLCRMQYEKLEVQVIRGRLTGYLAVDIPFRNYEYKQYYPWLKNEDIPEKMFSVEDRFRSGRSRRLVHYPEHNPDRKPRFFAGAPDFDAELDVPIKI
jgi:small subunit ribosomal protein S18b